jgi:hypothetical protein
MISQVKIVVTMNVNHYDELDLAAFKKEVFARIDCLLDGKTSIKGVSISSVPKIEVEKEKDDIH